MTHFLYALQGKQLNKTAIDFCVNLRVFLLEISDSLGASAL